MLDNPSKVERYFKKKKSGFQHQKGKVSTASVNIAARDVDSKLST